MAEIFVGSPDTYKIGLWQDAPMSQQKTIGRRLRELRTARGMTIADAAAGADISRGYLNQLELDYMLPGRDALRGLADLYGVTMDFIESGATPAPNNGEFIEDSDELALLRFWRSLTRDERVLVARMLGWTDFH